MSDPGGPEGISKREPTAPAPPPPPTEPSLQQVDIHFWNQIKYLGAALSAVSAAAGLQYALQTPQSGNQATIVAICLAILVVSLLFLLVPAKVVATHRLRSLFFGIWAGSLAIAATVLAWLDFGLLSPFIILYLVAMVFAGVAAPRPYVIGTGVLCFGGYAVLHEVTSVPWSGGSRYAGVMLLLILVASAWIADTQAKRADRLERLSAALGDEIDKAGWMMDATPEGIYLVDADGLITLANPAAERMLRRTRLELVGAPAHELFHHSHRDGSPFPAEECEIRRSVVSSYLNHAEADVYWRPDGTPFDVESTTVPAPHGGSMVAFHDVSERLANERLKGQFIAVVSHELRTPLTSVRGALGLLAGGAAGELTPEVANMVRIAATNTDRLSRLINDILDVDRLEAGKVVFTFEEVDVTSIIRAAIDEMRVMAEQHGVTLRGGSAPLMVHADADRVQQVVVNLLSNAVKFSDRGQDVIVSATVTDHHARIDVVDLGRGIPDERREHVFNRFEQVDASDARDKGGVGLGLAICEGIVLGHGGRIWFESVYGAGTTFSFTLPLAARMEPAALRSSGPPVVVIDGNPIEACSITNALTDAGYRTLLAATGAEGIDLAIAEHPVAVVLDVDLADMDPWEVVRTLRRRVDTASLALVLLGRVGSEPGAPLDASIEVFIDRTTLHTTLVETVDRALRDGSSAPSVLIVEDDADLAEVLAAGFRRRGVVVGVAGSVADAEAWCAHVPPDVILLDLMLPDGCGADLVASLRANGGLDRTGLAVYSALDLTAESRDGMGLDGASVFVKSKATPEVVLEHVLRLIGAASRKTAGAAP